MNNQEILNRLSELESEFYYRADGSNNAEGVNLENIKQIHTELYNLVAKWNKLTGCTLK